MSVTDKRALVRPRGGWWNLSGGRIGNRYDRSAIRIAVCLAMLVGCIAISGCSTCYAPGCAPSLATLIQFPNASRLAFWKKPVIEEVILDDRQSCSVHVTPEFQANRPRRVLMLSAGPTRGNFRENEKLIAELAARIRGDGIADVIAPAGERLHMLPENIVHGRFDEREIAAISRQYHADAVALVRISEFRSFSPLRAAVTMVWIDCRETVVTLAVDGVWDTSQPSTRCAFENFTAYRTAAGGATDFSRAIELHSSRQLFSFIAKEVSESIRDVAP